MATARVPPPTANDPVQADRRTTKSNSKMTVFVWFASSMGQAKNP